MKAISEIVERESELEFIKEYKIPIHTISGLARQCPACKVIAHYEIKSRKPQKIECVECGNVFTVQKYKRGERPKAKTMYEIIEANRLLKKG